MDNGSNETFSVVIPFNLFKMNGLVQTMGILPRHWILYFLDHLRWIAMTEMRIIAVIMSVLNVFCFVFCVFCYCVCVFFFSIVFQNGTSIVLKNNRKKKKIEKHRTKTFLFLFLWLKSHSAVKLEESVAVMNQYV